MTSLQRPRRGPPIISAWLFVAATFALVAPSALVGSTTDGAWALHTQLEESRPADAETLTASPSEVWLRFSTEVQVRLSTLELRGPSNELVGLGALEFVAGSNSTELRVAIPEGLPTGTYTVAWTTAGPDSHIIEGSFAFAVDLPVQVPTTPDSAELAPTVETTPTPAAGAAGTAAAGSSELSEATAPLGLLSRWIQFLASVLLVGVTVFHITVVGAAKRRGEADAVAAFLPRLRGFGYLAASLALLASVVRLADGFVSFGASRIGALVFGGPWGLSWWLYLLGAITAFVGVRVAGRAGVRAAGWRLLTLGALLTTLSVPFAGHGWAAPSRVIAAPAHVIHMIGAGMWMGCLAVLVFVALPFLASRKDAEGRSAEAPAWVASFSQVALIGVGVLLLSGAVNSWQHVGSVGALFGTLYGKTLLVKIGVLAGALLLGLYNWKQARPALDETGRPGLIRLPATVEVILGFAVLLVTAALVAMHLPS